MSVILDLDSVKKYKKFFPINQILVVAFRLSKLEKKKEETITLHLLIIVSVNIKHSHRTLHTKFSYNIKIMGALFFTQPQKTYIVGTH